MNFSEAVRKAKPSDYIVGFQRRMFKIDSDVLKAADADGYKKNGTIPEKFELAVPTLAEIADLSWEVVLSPGRENLQENLREEVENFKWLAESLTQYCPDLEQQKIMMAQKKFLKA